VTRSVRMIAVPSYSGSATVRSEWVRLGLKIGQQKVCSTTTSGQVVLYCSETTP